MTLHAQTSLTAAANAAIDLTRQMRDWTHTDGAARYLRLYLDAMDERAARAATAAAATADPEATAGSGATAVPAGTVLPLNDTKVAEAMRQITARPWREGEVYLLAPALTGEVATTAAALDLTGEVLPPQTAPADMGVLFLARQLYHRALDGSLSGIGALTWAPIGTPDGLRAWVICGWTGRDDPHPPGAARLHAQLSDAPAVAARLGPYLLADHAMLPIDAPIPGRPQPPQPTESAVTAPPAPRRTPRRGPHWEPVPAGGHCIEEQALRTPAGAAVTYAFWRMLPDRARTAVTATGRYGTATAAGQTVTILAY
jgi:hypothetical protein